MLYAENFDALINSVPAARRVISYSRDARGVFGVLLIQGDAGQPSILAAMDSRRYDKSTVAIRKFEKRINGSVRRAILRAQFMRKIRGGRDS